MNHGVDLQCTRHVHRATFRARTVCNERELYFIHLRCVVVVICASLLYHDVQITLLAQILCVAHCCAQKLRIEVPALQCAIAVTYRWSSEERTDGRRLPDLISHISKVVSAQVRHPKFKYSVLFIPSQFISKSEWHPCRFSHSLCPFLHAANRYGIIRLPELSRMDCIDTSGQLEWLTEMPQFHNSSGVCISIVHGWSQVLCGVDKYVTCAIRCTVAPMTHLGYIVALQCALIHVRRTCSDSDLFSTSLMHKVALGMLCFVCSCHAL